MIVNLSFIKIPSSMLPSIALTTAFCGPCTTSDRIGLLSGSTDVCDQVHLLIVRCTFLASLLCTLSASSSLFYARAAQPVCHRGMP